MARIRRAMAREQGMTIIEVLVSAVMVAIVAVGTFTAFDAAEHASADQKRHTVAAQLAQAEQDKLRGLSTAALSNYDQTTTTTVAGTAYTMRSTTQYVTDSTGTASCSTTNAAADYISAKTTVGWTALGSRPKVIESTIISPPSGAITANEGALAIQVNDSAGTPISGASVTAAGPETATGTTNANGCLILGDMTAGNYTVTLNSSGLVSQDGVSPSSIGTSVTGGTTTPVSLLADTPGALKVTFDTMGGTATQGDSVVVFQTGMSAPDYKLAGTVGAYVSSLTIPNLFPFTSPYSVYGGSCTANDPSSSAFSSVTPRPTAQSATVTENGTTNVLIHLPALKLTVTQNNSAYGSAHVVVTETGCVPNVKRTVQLGSNGQLTLPVPYGTYTVCADNGSRYVQTTVVNKDWTNGTTVSTLNINTSFFFGSPSGTCS